MCIMRMVVNQLCVCVYILSIYIYMHICTSRWVKNQVLKHLLVKRTAQREERNISQNGGIHFLFLNFFFYV